MKTVASLADLQDFGVVPLTGEADNLAFRCLCDLTRQGASVVAETYGLKYDGFQPAWNTGAEQDPHVGSCMLPYDAWQAIGLVALFQRGATTVLQTEKGVLFGLFGDERYERPARLYRDGVWMDWPNRAYGRIVQVYTQSAHPHQGTRNVHSMSGRTQ